MKGCVTDPRGSIPPRPFFLIFPQLWKYFFINFAKGKTLNPGVKWKKWANFLSGSRMVNVRKNTAKNCGTWEHAQGLGLMSGQGDCVNSHTQRLAHGLLISMTRYKPRKCSIFPTFSPLFISPVKQTFYQQFQRGLIKEFYKFHCHVGGWVSRR